VGFFATSGILNRRGFFGGVQAFSPSNISGLSLWLKADAGVTETPETFISQVVINGADTSTSNGTYTRASGGSTQFDGPNGNYIDWDGSNWYVNDSDVGEITYYNSTFDFSGTWEELFGSLPVPTSSTSTTPTGNTLVTAWADQSGNGNNCSSPISVLLNSSPYPSLYFNGTNSEITLNANIFNSYSALSLFAVWSIVNNGNNGVIGSNAYSSFEIVTVNESYVRMRNNNFDATINFGGWWNAEQFSLSTLAIDTSNASGTMRKNGSTSGVDFTPENSQALQGGQTYKIGRYAEIAGNYFAELSLAELIVYDEKLDGSQITQVEQYLNDKYEIY